ncbi:4-hydroxyphenylacetate 3-hydroxylase N-terminal domain-containing protein [Desulfotignum phosphitoxidans]|uniref:4-hydroxybutyryl-CoA dehydratase/vinylacetyl-CoA-delta-isomerase n=1 Tax=Desulfotignum phosphitoxidans DSM 13687 TaxID=1286635 RepID=S0G7I5_9BACT|nr:4-hydroxyphenylacetate 3-hydroxylase N-terminal domain-containing protein [Desulfotignum phosphitoxidans]EMS80936.1 4-hydroxybutyryl-CoA dehydratase/vinylacetyl-CoA-delta-isomerase [Desulfotignum phosphitoxidans DSM 13687]
MLRTKEQYHEDLFAMRPNIFIGGKPVGRDDPRLRPGINVLDITFDLAQTPEWKGLATAVSTVTGAEINRWAHLPQNPQDLLQKQKLIRLGARRAGGCIQRCMGHDAINALAICTREMDDANGTEYHRRFLDYLKVYHEKDLDGCCAQTDSKGDRMKRPSEQSDPDAYLHIKEEREDGIVVSGFKMSITQAAYADEIIVLPTRALIASDRNYAVAFAVPGDAEGMSLITRPVWLRENDKEGAAPFCTYGVSDCVVFFDNVFVPKERVFMCGEWQFGRRLALLFADSHRHSYSGCKPAVSDILCGTTCLAAEANNIANASHVKEKLSEFAGAAELAFAAGVAAAVYGKKTDSGVFFPNEIYANVGRRLTGEMIYHEYNILTEIAGGISVTMPFDEDFEQGKNAEAMKRFIIRNPNLSVEDSLKIWQLVEHIGASSMASWYKIAGVHGGGSPIMETIALNLGYDFEDKKRLARYLAGIDNDLDDSKMRDQIAKIDTQI